jgi:hypothetical protein
VDSLTAVIPHRQYVCVFWLNDPSVWKAMATMYKRTEHSAGFWTICTLWPGCVLLRKRWNGYTSHIVLRHAHIQWVCNRNGPHVLRIYHSTDLMYCDYCSHLSCMLFITCSGHSHCHLRSDESIVRSCQRLVEGRCEDRCGGHCGSSFGARHV